LNRGFFAVALNDPQSLPWVFVEESQCAVEGSATPGLQRKIPDIIQLFQHVEHIGGTHPGGREGLMAVTQDGFHNFNGVFIHGNPPSYERYA
jgi:hypothetical protein